MENKLYEDFILSGIEYQAFNQHNVVLDEITIEECDGIAFVSGTCSGFMVYEDGSKYYFADTEFVYSYDNTISIHALEDLNRVKYEDLKMMDFNPIEELDDMIEKIGFNEKEN